MASRIRVYSALSLDGFLAGESDELDWLHQPDAEPVRDGGVVDFESMMAMTGVLLMGRRTYDVVRGVGAWPYGDTPVLVASHRDLEDPPASTRRVSGNIVGLCTQARDVAGEHDVYLDGGGLISQAMDAGLIDEMILTVAPVFLGRGIGVYQGDRRHHWVVEHVGRYGAFVQLVLVPSARAAIVSSNAEA